MLCIICFTFMYYMLHSLVQIACLLHCKGFVWVMIDQIRNVAIFLHTTLLHNALNMKYNMQNNMQHNNMHVLVLYYSHVALICWVILVSDIQLNVIVQFL